MPRTLLDLLRQKYPKAKITTLKRMVEAGRVRVGGGRASRLKQIVDDTAGVEVIERSTEKLYGASAHGSTGKFPTKPNGRRPRGDLRIVYEDQDVLVVNKPAGLLTSTGPREKRPTLLAAVRAYLDETAPGAIVGLVHRLDRDASGLLVFSKSDAAYRSLKTQFFHHTVARVYLAVTEGRPTPVAGRIESRLRERADGTVFTVTEAGPGVDKGQVAITEYETVRAGPRSLLRVKLHTGRKHQIRVHLSERGVPIVGDPVYGKQAAKRLADQTADALRRTGSPRQPISRREKLRRAARRPDSTRGAIARPDDARSDGSRRDDAKANRLLLAAVTLEFDHPRTGRRISLTVDPPEDFNIPEKPAVSG
jgi:23S rRNA pseudouridine1911/1915/1917 synthase